ncbi:hypothetical protein HU200_053696 [Digitaria exilis]|uniref:G domain-containing protein n=1 Tax=Digitaria exilis TaxID=1010633 RepID=A0A835AH00_9POAL|nr:hypothetical protein HU200_053696 [Digitaria exilis]
MASLRLFHGGVHELFGDIYEFAEYVAVSPVSDGEESDECCVCDNTVEALQFGRRQQDRLRDAKGFIRRGAGKSTLVNRITRVFDKDDDPFAPDRAQISNDKPVVVVTHGDKLSILQRAHVQNELAELLGIPVQQIFDIPGSDDYQTDLAILDMLRHCIQHAEQNLPIKLNYLLEV